MAHAINWFEIPVRDLDRAVTFYEQILGEKLRREDFGGRPMAIFPYEEGPGVGGALITDPNRKPSADGVLPYLNTTGRLDAALAAVPKARGEIILPKTDIGGPGYIAVIRDTEGNLIGLHEPHAEAATSAA
jgi:predicted enzyme related to lactoylglutathione lyase